MNTETEKFTTLRTLYWILEISGWVNSLLLAGLWWMGYYFAFMALLVLWVVSAFVPGSRYGTLSKLESELLSQRSEIKETPSSSG